ncbi:MAG: transcription antitermination factor NusB [Elusimicrobia bacterium GWA2_38_7]|nr:MAG: transcription antitermination factor NusB [Elusimicrobia bacterium GWA2_38_7]
MLSGVLDRQEEIDTLIRRYTENWDIRRMAAIDRNILRISTFEILTDLETPISVIIDEAIEISKNYSTEDSSKFVNGILDKIKGERKI